MKSAIHIGANGFGAQCRFYINSFGKCAQGVSVIGHKSDSDTGLYIILVFEKCVENHTNFLKMRRKCVITFERLDANLSAFRRN